MLKKTITYKNFNDEEVSEDYYFHLSQAELVELELSHEGGMAESLQKIIDAEDGKEIIAEFKKIILGSYGVRSPDGKRFTKNQQLRDEFESTEAYSTLFMELVTETDKAVEFVNGIIPKGLAETAMKVTGANLAVVADEEVSETKPIIVRVITKAEAEAMSKEDLLALWHEIKQGTARLADDDTT